MALKTRGILIFIFYCVISTACSEKSNKQEDIKSSKNQDNLSIDRTEKEKGENDEIESSSCNLSDGTYLSTVNYNNPETGYSNTYTLDVEVEDCKIIKINFPNGGWLDEDHITEAEIDEDGTATVDGEDGKTYEIQINK